MTDCPNAEMRDLLPDLVHGTLSAGDRERVERHVATCAECAAELSLLRRARAATSARVPAVDVAAIVRALPAPPRAARQAVDADASAGVVSLDAARRARAARRPMMRMVGWRQAAAVTAIVAGGAALALMRGGAARDGGPVPVPVTAQQNPSVTTAPVQVASAGAGASGATTAPATAATASGLSMAGGVSDLSDEQLVALLGDIDSLDGAPDTEPAAVLPDMTGETNR